MKHMVRELDLKQKGHAKTKILISRIQPYLDHYKLNCQVKGMSEIESMIKAVEEAKRLLGEVKEMITGELGELGDSKKQG